MSNDSDFKSSNQLFQQKLPSYFRTIFEGIHDELMAKKEFDSYLSGSTVCAVLFDSCKIYCANAGDSRAVLFT